MPLLYLSVSGASADCLTRLPFPCWNIGAGGGRDLWGRKREKEIKKLSKLIQLLELQWLIRNSSPSCNLLLKISLKCSGTWSVHPVPAEEPGVFILYLLTSLNIVQSPQTQHRWFGDHICVPLMCGSALVKQDRKIATRRKMISLVLLPPSASASEALKLMGCRWHK